MMIIVYYVATFTPGGWSGSEPSAHSRGEYGRGKDVWWSNVPWRGYGFHSEEFTLQGSEQGQRSTFEQ